MPLTHFECPEGEYTEVSSCLAGCHRAEGRCLSLPTLYDASSQRKWTGKPSTTQCINGTRLAYLELTKPYTNKPKKQGFRLLGNAHHHRLDKVAEKLNVLSEEQLGGGITGILDLLTEDETTDIECYELWDYKTWGSFKVAKALGVMGKKVPDPSGAVYQKDSKYGKKGDPKMVTEFYQDENAVDMWEAELQQNHYRLKVEPLGFPVSTMWLQITVRDGDLYIAHNRGVYEQMYKIPVARLDDQEVLTYFDQKGSALIHAMDTGEMPEMCSPAERWDGRRCAKYCDVAQHCPEGLATQPLGDEDAEV